MNQNTILKLSQDFPGHSFDTKSGNFGIQLMLDGKLVCSTWDMMTTNTFSESTNTLSSDDAMYIFVKEKVKLFLENKRK